MLRLQYAIKKIAFCVLFLGAGAVFGQQDTAPRNVVQLSASAALDVPQDWLQLTLSTSRDGADAQVVQAQLKTALDAALKEARAAAEPGALQVRTGNFSLVPRRDRDGRLTGWQGTAELLLEGRDLARISSTVGRIQTLTVVRAAFSLSREQQARVESQVQAQAIERFKARAGEVARAFGYASYGLREVTVSSNEINPPRPRMMALAAGGATAEALPVEAGQGTVQVTVSGSVQLQP
jgi:predicted secreted protein